MKIDRLLRVTLGVVLALAFVIAIAAFVFITESALNVWDRLRETPPVVMFAYLAILLSLFVTAAWLIVKLLVRRKPRRKKARTRPAHIDIEARLDAADRDGVDVSAAQAELAELASRRSDGAVHLCFFGEISTGKSSLIKALVPDAEVEVDVLGGSTSEVHHYRWRNDAGADIVLSDVPGTAGLEGGLGEMAIEEARRAHVVLYVCDGDLARTEMATLQRLLELEKPVVVVMNKTDRYSAAEQAQLLARLLDRLSDSSHEIGRERVVAVSAGGEVDVVERREDGSERRSTRSRPADIGVLVVAINRLLSSDRAVLDTARDRAVFALADDKLRDAEAEYRRQRADQVLRSSTRKAVLGALAAVSPGTDIVIQGYVATAMTRELCELYGIAPRDLDIQEFLTLSESRAGKALPLALAVAGNGLKAFPGIGTVAGGLVHAVAYGLIFDALGRSLLRTLTTRGELVPEAAAAEFEESIGEHLEAGVRQVAKMALAETDEKR